MHASPSPRSALALFLPIGLILTFARCSDGGDGVTEPPAGQQPAISVAVGTSTLALTRGQAGSVTVTVARTGGFNGAVDLSIAGVPSDVTGSFEPARVPAGAVGSTLTLEIGFDAPTGASQLVVRGRADGVADETAAVALSIAPAPAYALTLEPSSLSLPQGETAEVGIGIERTDFTGAVALSVSGAPEGTTVAVEPTSTTGDGATLGVAVDLTTAPGDYTLVVTGHAEGLADRAVDLELTVGQPEPAGDWVYVSASGLHTCAITESGDAYCWGQNNAGQLGDGSDTTAQTRPVLVAGGHQWKTVSTGGTLGRGFTCGITTAGIAYCWGDNWGARLGIGTTSGSERSPVPVAAPEGATWTSVSAGGEDHACALATDGAAYCWGQNWNGKLGIGTFGGGVGSTPVLVAGGHSWKQISAGWRHTCAISTSGDAYCWGSNSLGELGDTNAGVEESVPVLVPGGHEWETIVAGAGRQTCGVTTAREAYCWGSNEYGKTGLGYASLRVTTPTRVPGDLEWASLIGGTNNTCGVTADNTAHCWGFNTYGQIGNGTTSLSVTSPEPVADGRAWRQLAAGRWHVCGVTQSGAAYCWGRGEFGSLGNGSASTTVHATPLEVLRPE